MVPVMLGHNVRVYLSAPDEQVSGELREQNAEGVWIYGGFQEQAKLRFYPQHRILEIQDNGYTYR